jgi:hypothetical protein
MTAAKYQTMKIIEALPLALHRPEGGEKLLRRMQGAKIVKIGGANEDGIEGGGLLIDYVPISGMETHRVVFAFNELGLWLEWEGLIPAQSE